MFLNRFTSIARQCCRINQLSGIFRSLSVSASSNLCRKFDLEKVQTSSISVDSNINPINEINEQLNRNAESRLFAVVHLCGKQFKITTGDVILLEGYWPPENGDKLRLEKVLVVGSKDFSLIGRPILQNGLVDIQATVIEKSLSHTRTHYKKKRRKQYQRINFQRTPTTLIRINSIDVVNNLEQNLISEKDIERIY